MSTESTRSKEVVEDYKKRKLAISALRKIQEIILGFDEEHASNARMARVGLIIIVVLIAAAAYFYLSMDSVTLS